MEYLDAQITYDYTTDAAVLISRTQPNTIFFTKEGDIVVNGSTYINNKLNFKDLSEDFKKQLKDYING